MFLLAIDKRVKSHLQKFRRNKDKSIEEFMNDYDSVMYNFNHFYKRQGESNPTKKNVIENFHMFTNSPSAKSGVMTCGEVAAYLTMMHYVQDDYEVRNSNNRCSESDRTELPQGTKIDDMVNGGISLQNVASTQPLNFMSSFLDGKIRHDKIFFPELTDEEKQSSLGANLCLVMGMFQSLVTDIKKKRARNISREHSAKVSAVEPIPQTPKHSNVRAVVGNRKQNLTRHRENYVKIEARNMHPESMSSNIFDLSRLTSLSHTEKVQAYNETDNFKGDVSHRECNHHNPIDDQTAKHGFYVTRNPMIEFPFEKNYEYTSHGENFPEKFEIPATNPSFESDLEHVNETNTHKGEIPPNDMIEKQINQRMRSLSMSIHSFDLNEVEESMIRGNNIARSDTNPSKRLSPGDGNENGRGNLDLIHLGNKRSLVKTLSIDSEMVQTNNSSSSCASGVSDPVPIQYLHDHVHKRQRGMSYIGA